MYTHLCVLLQGNPLECWFWMDPKADAGCCSDALNDPADPYGVKIVCDLDMVCGASSHP